MKAKIIPRKFNFKFERNNKDGTKTPIDVASLDAEAYLRYQTIVLDLIDRIVEKDSCQEAEQELTAIYSRWK
jgi:hypothetical protein